MTAANESQTPEQQGQNRPASGSAGAPSQNQDQKATVEELALPKGAMLAMRKRNTSAAREVVVYPDGRVTHSLREKPDNRLPRKLSDAQIANLRHMLDEIGFFRMPSAVGEPTDDSFVYEIGAHLGNRTHYVLCYTENMPGPLVPLIERLTELLPPES